MLVGGDSYCSFWVVELEAYLEAFLGLVGRYPISTFREECLKVEGGKGDTLLKFSHCHYLFVKVGNSHLPYSVFMFCFMFMLPCCCSTLCMVVGMLGKFENYVILVVFLSCLCLQF